MLLYSMKIHKALGKGIECRCLHCTVVWLLVYMVIWDISMTLNDVKMNSKAQRFVCIGLCCLCTTEEDYWIAVEMFGIKYIYVYIVGVSDNL